MPYPGARSSLWGTAQLTYTLSENPNMSHRNDDAANLLGISPEFFKDAFKRYRSDVPSVGTVSSERAQELLEEGFICRGWVLMDEGKLYFHVIKSPTDFPQKAILTAASEKELFAMSVMLGIENEIEFEDLVSE
jgi:hypothetical protein